MEKKYTSFQVGDAVEARAFGSEVEYLSGRVIKVNKDKKKNVMTYDVEYDGNKGKESGVDIAKILRKGQTEYVWNCILNAFERAQGKGRDVGKLLREHIGTDYCVVQQFCNFVHVLDGETPLIDHEVASQVLRQHDCVDALGEVVLYSKLQKHPNLGKFVDPIIVDPTASRRPKSLNSPNKLDVAKSPREVTLQQVESIFNRYSPITITTIAKAMGQLNTQTQTLTAKEKDGIKTFFKEKSLGPRSKLTLEQFVDVCKFVGFRGLGDATSNIFGTKSSVSYLENVEKNIRNLVKISFDHGVDCRELFESFDENFDGTVTIEEFVNGLQRLGVKIDETVVRDVLRHRIGPQAAEKDRVEYRQFLSLLTPEHWQIKVTNGLGHEKAVAAKEKLRAMIENSKAENLTLREAFEHFDENKNGMLDRGEFRKGLAKLGIELSKEEIRLLMRLFECNDSYEVSYREFCEEFDKSASEPNTLMDAVKDLMKTCYAQGKVDWVTHFESMDGEYSGFLPLEAVADSLLKFGLPKATLDLEAFRAILKRQGLVGKEEENDKATGFNEETVNYRALISKLVPDCWLKSGKDHKQIVHETLDKLMDLVLDAVSKGATLEECFSHFDIDRDQMTSAKEFRAGLTELGLKLGMKETRLLMRHFSPEHNNSVSLSDFKETIRSRTSLHNSLSSMIIGAYKKGLRVEEAFASHDVDKSGLITVEEFCSALQQLGIAVKVDEIRSFVKAKHVFDGGSTIAYGEFLRQFNKDATVHFNHNNVAKPLPLPVVQSPTAGNATATSPIRFTETKQEYSPVAIPDYHLQGGIGQVLGRLKKLVHYAMEHGVSMEDSFKHFDVNGNGFISQKEFRKGLVRLGFDLSKEEIKYLVEHFLAEKGSDEVSLHQFFKILKQWEREYNASDREELRSFTKARRDDLLYRIRTLIADAQERGIDNRACFEHFDKDRNGLIDVKELRNGLQRLGCPVSDYEAQALMDEFGVEKMGGNISYENFLRMIGIEEQRQQANAILKKLQLNLAKLYVDLHTRDSIAAELKRKSISSTSKNGHDEYSLRTTFAEVDVNKDGIISTSDFLAILTRLRLYLPQRDIHLLLKRLDANGDSVIDASEFVDIVEPPRVTLHLRGAALKLLAKPIENHALLNPFQHFDLNQTGCVTKREFRCCISALGFRLSNMELDVLCDVLDLHDDGKVHYDEFIKFMEVDERRKHQLLSPRSPQGNNNNGTNAFASPKQGKLDPLGKLEQELEEFVAMAETMNIPIKETLRHFDKNDDGTITWQEFYTAMVELGFECTEVQLQKLLERVRSFDKTNYPSNVTGTEEQKVNYEAFLKYWIALRDKTLDRRTEKEVQIQARRLKKELRQFLIDSTKRGVRMGEVFSHFDADGDGLVSVQEFEQAISDIFAHDQDFDRRVIKKFMESIDQSKDNKIDYLEFLGLERRSRNGSSADANGTWQAVFGARRFQKSRMTSISVAESIVQMVIRNAEQEIAKKGDVWHQVRKNLASRVNNGTFIQRNKAAAGNKTYCRRTFDLAKELDEKRKAEEEGKKTTNHRDNNHTSSNGTGKSASMAKRIRIAERMYVAEMAAARMAEEAAIRAEEAANRDRLKNLEESAISHAIDSIDGAVFFLSKSKALQFLESIGLSRFEGRISARPHKNLDSCYVFALKDDQELKRCLGSCSTIVARKVKREIINLLRICDEQYNVHIPHADLDPEQWTVKQTQAFAASCGLGSTNHFEEYGIDGESLLELQVSEGIRELGFSNEFAIQTLIFRASYLHYVAQKQKGMVHETSSSQSNHQQIFNAIRLEDKIIARPSNQPVTEWTVNDVCELINGLDICDTEFRKLAIDGNSLLELTDGDIKHELKLSGRAAEKLASAVEALKQPSYLSLGNGPYLEARVASNTDGLLQQPECTYVSAKRELDLWVHVGPALTKAVDIAKRAHVEKDKNNSLRATSKSSTLSSSPDELGNSGPDSKMVKDEESRLMRFIAQAIRGGHKVLQTFSKHDKNKLGFVSWADFEQVLLELGYKIDDYGLFRLMIRERLDKKIEMRIHYQEFYVKCLNRAEYHCPVFSKTLSDANIAFTTDGLKASLLVNRPNPDGTSLDTGNGTSDSSILPSNLQNRTVKVRFGGGSTLYDAVIVADHGDSTYDVQYVDTNDVECVPFSWIDFDSIERLKTENETLVELDRCKSAICEVSLSTGVHVWKQHIKHASGHVAIGVTSYQGDRRRFAGILSNGELLLQGYHESRANIIRKLSTVSKRGFTSGDQLTLKLDLDASELKIYAEDKTSEEFARIRLDELYKTDETIKIQEIKNFLMANASDLEMILQDKPQAPKYIATSVVLQELKEMGINSTDTELLAFFQPFLSENKHGVDIKGLLDGLNLNRRWDGEDEEDRVVAYHPSTLLSTAGDCVQMDTRIVERENNMKSVFKVGKQVMVRFGAGSTWYKATVEAVSKKENEPTTYDVIYEDGDTEANVLQVNIRDVEKEEMDEDIPKDRLILRVYARLLAYELKDDYGKKKSKFQDVLEKLRNQNKAKHLLEVPRNGSSFSNVGKIRTQELLRKRLNEPDSVNWTYTVTTSHSFFAPLAMQQSNVNLVQTKKEGLLEDEWVLLGNIDLREHEKLLSGESGVPFTLRVDSNMDNVYYRLAIMTQLGTVDPTGTFKQIYAPVQPIQSVLQKAHKQNVAGKFEHEFVHHADNHVASRFFLLSAPIRVFGRSNSNDPAHMRFNKLIAKNKTKKKAKKSKQVASPNVGVPKLSFLTNPKHPKTAIHHQDNDRHEFQQQPSQSPNRKQPRPHHVDKKSRKLHQQPPQQQIQRGKREFTKDEQIVIDRWLALVGLNEFGEPIETKYTNDQHLPQGVSRYDRVLQIHPTEPWMQFARDHHWLATKEEMSKIRRWARRTKEDAPSRFSHQQTLYEALVQIHPTKPWLDSRSGHGKSQHKPSPPTVSSPSKARNLTKFQEQPHRVTTTSKKSTVNEAQLRKEIEASRRNVTMNLESFERDYEAIARAKVEEELKDQVQRDDQEIKRVSRLMAKEATARANEQAQLEWEREEQLRRAKQMQLHQEKLDHREAQLRSIEDQLTKQAVEQKWADRISKTYDANKGVQGPNNMEQTNSNDPWERAVSKKKKNCPI